MHSSGDTVLHYVLSYVPVNISLTFVYSTSTINKQNTLIHLILIHGHKCILYFCCLDNGQFIYLFGVLDNGQRHGTM